MNSDSDKKRELLAEWWGELLPRFAVRLLARGAAPDPELALLRLADVADVFSVYVLLARDADLVPVYIGKSAVPRERWKSHLQKLKEGTGSYRRWRERLLGADGLVATDLDLLVVPETAITRPPIPNFPVSVGSVEYQLIGLAADAHPGRLLNHEGQGRC